MVDTPGFFDTDGSEEEMKPEILKCIIECAPGPHAFLIVLRVDRFTEQEQAVVKKVLENFSEEVFKYAIVVFTHGDQLPEGTTIANRIRKNKLLSNLVRKCGGRFHVFDNKYWSNNTGEEYRSNKYQVEKLLHTIEKMVKENGGRLYTNETLQAVEEEIQLEEENMALLPGNMSETENRERAKVGVFKRLLIKLAGIGAGALLGALLGAGVMAAGVVAVLKERTSLTAVGIGAAVGAVGGAVAGGIDGYNAVEDAETPVEAAVMAAKSLKRRAQLAIDKTRDVFAGPSPSKLKKQ